LVLFVSWFPDMANQKKVFIMPRWAGNHEVDWYPWITIELQKHNVQVTVLDLPSPNSPTIVECLDYLEKNITELNPNTFLVGHSVGGQAILRFLEKKSTEGLNTKVGGAVFVAAWFAVDPPLDSNLPGIGHWINTPINGNAVASVLKKPVLAIFSDDDFVCKDFVNNAKSWEKFGAKPLFEKSKQHYNAKQEPSVLNAILELINGE